MRSFYIAILLLILALPTRAALSVTILVEQEAYCTASTGRLSGHAYGGEEPYTWAWSNGDTTAIIYDLPAGTYTVTVTDAAGTVATAMKVLVQADLTSSFDAMISPGWIQPWCDASGPIMYWAVNSAVWGPPPYFANGEEVFPSEVPGGNIYFIPISADVGDSISIPFENASGCTGTFNWVIPPPIQWPSVSVDQVNGACGGNNNGSILVTFTGGFGMYDLEDADSNMVVPQTGVGDPALTAQFTGLAPGTYNLYLRSYFLDSGYPELCDTVMSITVPDLGAVCGQVYGTAYMDLNEDCTLDSEPLVPYLVLSVQPGEQYAFTDTAGAYALNLQPGNYTVHHGSTMIEEHCIGAPIPFTIDSSLASVTVDLANLSSVGMDARIELHGSPARPGFPFSLHGTVQNLTPGNTGDLTLTLQFDPVLIFTNTGPTASNVTGNTITWDLAALPYFGQRGFGATFMVPADVNLLGTVLTNSAEVSTALPDADLSNNITTALSTIRGSYDPNDKRGLTDVSKSDDQFLLGQDGHMDYTIRFQNTGTDTAFTVVVRDEIDTDLEILSLDILGASHAFTPSFGEGRELVFTFANILLPDSTTNLLGSQGFISYRIKPKNTIAVGDVLENTAGIYFDFNPPVITNTTAHMVEFSTGVQAHAAGQHLWLMPNPTSGSLEVRVSDTTATGILQVISVDGRVVLQQRMEGPRTVLDVAQLSRGLYTLNWRDVNGTLITQRFVRE